MRLQKLIFLLFLTVSFLSKAQLVTNVAELHQAVKNAQPGAIITMANGQWQNAEILFEATGTASKPIILKAQEKGKVIISGESNLRIAGKHLLVEGLIFKNGFSSTADLIAFRKDAKNLANNCRITECVIDNFNGPERNNVEAWVVLFGKNNRVDHCQFINKRNQGVTLIVRLDSEENAENKHQIDHNYFGYRQNLGSNGGETLRIGTSHNSMRNSGSIVEYNYFDRCDGEHEIISNKSNQNTYRFNTFYECKGTLTMRHGNETHVEGNVLLGNGVPFTGGIRVINEKQTVINNYCEGLTGNRFRGALTVMNGVPNSPLNRYVPVKESTISNNTFVDCNYIELGAGNDSERSEAPQSTTVKNNLFYTSTSPQHFGVYADLSGITFTDNIVNRPTEFPSETGFEVKQVNLTTLPNGTKFNKQGGAEITEMVATLGNSGVSWYPKVEALAHKINVVQVKPGLNTLLDAIKTSKSNDVFELTAGEYNHTKIIQLTHPVTIKGVEGSVITFETNDLFVIENGGSLRLKNLTIDGKIANDSPLNSVVRTSKYSMSHNYSLFVDNCNVKNLKANNLFNFFRVSASTFADTVSITNSTFSKISGDVLAMNKEGDDIGRYNAETIIINNCKFTEIEGAAILFYRGGSDESTTAGYLTIDHSEFNNVGLGSKNASNAAIQLVGLQNLDIKNSIFEKTSAINMLLTVGEPKAEIHHSVFNQSPDFEINGEGFSQTAISKNIAAGSIIKGDDNKAVGIRK